MLPTINGKQLIECNEQDLQELIGNPDYKENEYLDYKSMFSVDKYNKGDENQQKAIAEFRSDVCSFANASGGYLILGIIEDKGLPTKICGIEIKDNNLDKFEGRLKNYLQKIQPKIPTCRFNFIPLHNGTFVVIILVLHDAFAPYLHVENEKDYRIYKRIGNDKRTIAYMELKNMFVNSIAMEKEIEHFRKERIAHFKEQEYARFILIHIIPDTFTDSNYNKIVYVLNKNNGDALSNIFDPFSCYYMPYSTADGFYRRTLDQFHEQECSLFNNCVAEVFDSLKGKIQKEVGHSPAYEHFPWGYFWEKINYLLNNYLDRIRPLLGTKRLFVCVSIFGCKGVRTEFNINKDYISTIDRDVLLFPITVFDDTDDPNANEKNIKQLKLNYMLSLGLTANDDFRSLMKEV